MTDNQIATRVLLGAGVAVGSLVLILTVLQQTPADFWHGGPRFYLGIVGTLVVVADRLYVRSVGLKRRSQE